MKYRQRSVAVDAIQWSGHTRSLTPLAPWTKVIYAPEVTADSRLIVRNMDSIITAEIGDWVIKGPDGSLSIMKDAQFQTLYERADH